jgi:autotransporter translocation and assembly factor TamB
MNTNAKADPVKKGRQKSLLRRLLAAMIIFVFLLVLIVVSSAWWLGTSEQGSRWLAYFAVDLVPDLQLEIESGSLAEGFKLRYVAWQTADFSVQAFDVKLAWSPSCLLASRLCLSELKMERLDIVSRAKPSPGPIELPEFVSPLFLTVTVLEIDQLTVSGVAGEPLVFERIESRNVALRRERLSAKRLHLQLLEQQMTIAGELRFVDDYPLSLTVAATVSALQQPLNAKLSGTVRQLQFELAEIEALPLRLIGTLSPLEPKFRVQAQLVAQQSFDWPVDDTTLAIKSLDAVISGDMASLTLAVTCVVSEPLLGDVPLVAKARWRDGHIWLDKGELQIQQYPLQVAGEIVWAQDLLPYLRDVRISHGASLLSLQGSFADGGIDWSLVAPALSDYLPLSGHASAQGKLKQAGSGYAVTINAQAQELIVDKNVSDVLSDVAGAALQLQCRLQLDMADQPMQLFCASGSATLPATNWSPSSEWALQQLPSHLLQFQQGELSLSPVCLQEQTSADLQLCLTDIFVFSANDYSELRFDLGNIPLAWFDRYIGSKASLTGDADIQVQVTRSDAVSQGASIVDALEIDWQARIAAYGLLQGRIDLPMQAMTVRGAAIDLAPLRQLYPDLGQLSGSLDVDLNASMKDGSPWVTGAASVHDGKLGIIGQAGLLASSLLQLELLGQQAKLQGQVAVEGGPAQLTGSIDWRTADWQAQLHLLADSLSIAPLPGVSLQLVPDLTLSASPQRTHLQGDVFIPSGVIDLSHLTGSPEVVSVSLDTQIVGERPQDDASVQFSSAVTVHLGDAVRFRGYGLVGRLFGSGALEKPADGNLLARGSVGVVDGRWRAYGQDLLVEDGRLEFNGPLDEPYLRLRAERRQTRAGDTVGVLVDGPLADPRIQLFSSEAMSEQERMHYLITGRRMDETTISTDGAAAQAAVAMGLASANQQLGKTAEQFGIQGFELGTEMGERGQEAQVSGYFGANLYLKYSYSMFEPGTAFSARYRLTDRFHIEGYQSTNSALNLLWYIRRR